MQRRKLTRGKRVILNRKRRLRAKRNKNRICFKNNLFRKRLAKNVLPNLHKHFCSFCGASADVNGSFCYQGVFACPRHENLAVFTYFKLIKRGQN